MQISWASRNSVQTITYRDMVTSITGCSKGACYFCNKWIVLHYKGLVNPASHDKVILGRRGLDAGLNNARAMYYGSMLRKMTGAIEQDINHRLFAGTPGYNSSSSFYERSESSHQYQSFGSQRFQGRVEEEFGLVDGLDWVQDWQIDEMA
jgi:hypothetical protein